ncbi:MAG: acylphosphatase [Opitutaceae bacterium]|jgi:acylphosphatase
MADVYHETVFFSGHVQGVGFRFVTLQVARGFEVSGFVTNLPDGRVQLEAAGEQDEVSAFITAIEERMHGFIRKVERSGRRGEAPFAGFQIK